MWMSIRRRVIHAPVTAPAANAVKATMTITAGLRSVGRSDGSGPGRRLRRRRCQRRGPGRQQRRPSRLLRSEGLGVRGGDRQGGLQVDSGGEQLRGAVLGDEDQVDEAVADGVVEVVSAHHLVGLGVHGAASKITWATIEAATSTPIAAMLSFSNSVTAAPPCRCGPGGRRRG